MKKMNVRLALVFLTLASSMALAASQLTSSDPNLDEASQDEGVYRDPLSVLVETGRKISGKVMGPTPGRKPEASIYSVSPTSSSVDLFADTKAHPGDAPEAIPPVDATGVSGAE